MMNQAGVIVQPITSCLTKAAFTSGRFITEVVYPVISQLFIGLITLLDYYVKEDHVMALETANFVDINTIISSVFPT